MYICSTDKSKPAYVPAFERWSLYKSIWMNHWEEFQRIYNTRFLSKYGELSDGKIEEVEKLLGCGREWDTVMGEVECKLLEKKIYKYI